MQIAIHAEFMNAWAKLSHQDRKTVQDMLLRTERNGITPGMRLHTITSHTIDLISLSPNMDLRVLGWWESDKLVLLYVDHHDKAYEWARRNADKLEIAETVNYTSQNLSALSGHSPTDETRAVPKPSKWMQELERKLISAGVPVALQRLLSSAKSEDEILDLLEFVSPEWKEFVLDAVVGKLGTAIPTTTSNIWVAPNDEALRTALSLPLSQWRLFLHPIQVDTVTADTSQDLVIVGGPGTGKTVALVHRAIELTKQCSDGECVVLVGHSPEAVRNLESMGEALATAQQLAISRLNALHVVDMIAIGRDGNRRDTDIWGPLSSKQGFLRHLQKDVRALLIDESQDIPGRYTRGWLTGRRPSIGTHITLAIDFNQNIFANNTEHRGLLAVLERGRMIPFSYCYRIPREAGLLGAHLLHKIQLSAKPQLVVESFQRLATSMTYGFCSNFIRVIAYEDISTGILEAAKEYVNMRSLENTTIGVIFCGNRNFRNRYSGELEKLGYGRADGEGISTPRSVKGQEFDYCIVIAPELLLEDSSKSQEFALRSIYVALSRCRRGLSVYTNEETAKLLIHSGVEYQKQ